MLEKISKGVKLNLLDIRGKITDVSLVPIVYSQRSWFTTFLIYLVVFVDRKNGKKVKKNEIESKSNETADVYQHFITLIANYLPCNFFIPSVQILEIKNRRFLSQPKPQ